MKDKAPLSDQHLAEAIALMRDHGASFSTGGSRCNTTWRHDPARGWTRDEFDEGASQRYDTSQASVEATLRAEPDNARLLLYRAARKPGIAALLAQDTQGVLDSIEKAGTYQSISADDLLLRALLRGDALRDRELAQLREHVSGHTFWHFWMNATGWTRTPENGARGLALLEQVIARIGPPEPPAAQAQRASFQRLLDQP